MLFRTVPSPTPYGLLFLKIWGFTTPTQNSNLRNGQSYGLQIWLEHSQGPSEQNPIKILEKRKRGRIQGLSIFGGVPLLSQERVKLRTSNLASTFIGPSEHKPIKYFGEKGAWAYPATARFLWVPPIISGTGKATNFQFCTHIYRLNRNKSPLKISGKVAVGVVRDSRKFSGHTYIGCIARSYLRWLSFLVIILVFNTRRQQSC